MALIGTIKYLQIGSNTYEIPTGSTVSITRNLTTGTKSATINIDGTDYDIYSTTPPVAATATPLMNGTAAIGSSAKYAKEDHVHPSDTSKVSKTGNETVAGNKTFSGTTSIAPESIFAVSNSTVIPANTSAVIQSPIPKYLWHDLFAFGRRCTPKYYTTTDGATWTEGTLEKRLFSHQEAWGYSNIISSTISGSRWTWSTNQGFHACNGAWLVIGVAYSSTIAHYDILFEYSGDGNSWTTLASVNNLSYQSVPIWIKTNGSVSENYIRLTITRNSSSASNTVMPIVSIRWLTARWGNQGGGSEHEYPYGWDGDANIFPYKNNEQTLGTSSYKWSNVYSTTFTGNLSGNATTATNAPTQASTDSSGLITFKNSSGTSLFTLQLPLYNGGVS